MTHRRTWAWLFAGLVGVRAATLVARADIVIENPEIRLVLGDDARVTSLLHRPTQTECVAAGGDKPAVWTLQQRGYGGDVQPRFVPASSVRREGDRLIVSFAPLVSRAVIRINITAAYLGFVLEKIEGDASFAAGKARPAFYNEETAPFDELCFLQLPVRDRGRFGDWLNVAWDDQLAVGLLATDPFTRVDAVAVDGHRLMRAAAVGDVRWNGVGAALVVTETPRLLDRIAQLEEDFGLPRGVRARRDPAAALSYWKINDPITPANVDRYLHYAQAAGLRQVLLYHRAFARTLGHFPWRDEYPNGESDLRAVVDRLASAGVTTGLHLHFTKAHVDDPYVRPVPDPRLNLRRTFTLAQGVSAIASEIRVLENPVNATLDEGRRLLRFGDELIAYTDYTTRAPFTFRGCQRGALDTRPSAHVSGAIGGLLDVDNWPAFVRFNQRTDIQREVAGRLARIYAAAGFRFAYFDGSEDVHAPYWFNVPHAQWQVYRELRPTPQWAETSTLAHFNWHMMSRSTAEDPVPAEQLKDFVRTVRLPEAAARARNFTRCNFGWIQFRAPGRSGDGMQPDIIEYASSRAAGWDCPLSIIASLRELEATPRTLDNLEVIRRWEAARASSWLTPVRRQELQRDTPEHTLLINESGAFELVPCRSLTIGGRDGTVRGVILERAGGVWVSYWDARGTSRLVVPLPAARVRRYRVLGEALPVEETAGGVLLVAAERQYLAIPGATLRDIEAAFAAAQISVPSAPAPGARPNSSR